MQPRRQQPTEFQPSGAQLTATVAGRMNNYTNKNIKIINEAPQKLRALQHAVTHYLLQLDYYSH